MKNFPFRPIAVLILVGTCGSATENTVRIGGATFQAVTAREKARTPEAPIPADLSHATTPLLQVKALAQRDVISKRLNAEPRGGFVRSDLDYTSARGARSLSVAVHPSAPDTVEVAIPSVAPLKLRLEKSATLTATLSEGALTYANALPFVDRIVASDADSVEELLLLKSKEAGTSFSWTLEANDVNAAADGRGGLIFYPNRAAEKARPLFAIPAPYALDAQGKRWPGALRWDGEHQRLSVALSLGPDAAYPMVLDPAIESNVWEQAGTPVVSTNPIMAFDEARGRLVMFTAGNTWTSHGEGWTRASDGGPSARFQTAMAYDQLRQRIVLFGGFDGSASSDTWEWDGTSWTKALPVTVPPARSGHSMAYDKTRRKVVVFGGLSGNNALSDMWEWTGTAWNEIVPAAAPSARGDAAMALDSNRGVIVLFGGVTSPAVGSPVLDDTWEWDGTTWTQKVTAAHPSARARAAVAFDGRNKRMTLFGGQQSDEEPNNELWYWDGNEWTQVSPIGPIPEARAGAAAGFISGVNRILMAGGSSGGNTTWAWNSVGVEWYSLTDYANPIPTAGPIFVYDGARQYSIAQGGSTRSGASVSAGANDHQRGSIWTGTSWIDAGDGPGYLTGSAAAFDEARGKVVLFGGYDAANPAVAPTPYGVPNLNSFDGTTALWNGSGWTQQTPVGSPSVRGNASMTYDSLRQRVLLFGGYTPGYGGGGTGCLSAIPATPPTSYNELWSWNGSVWQNITPTTPGAPLPDGRADAAFAYDVARDRVVMFGGQIEGAVLNDTWEFDGTGWKYLTPVHVPAVNSSPALAYDSVRKQMTLFAAIRSATGGVLRTWTWDGVDWTDTSSGAAPPSRDYPRVVFDKAHSEYVLFGGANLDPTATALSDTWRLYVRGGSCTQASDCDTGFCTDGVCCETQTCGSCEACNIVGSSGTCAKVRNADDADSCLSGNSCDSSGACKPKNGQACSAGTDCASGFCVDSVCCDTECKGSCHACRADLKESGPSGTCGDAKNGVDPHNDCPDDGVISCQRDGRCDGAGRCRSYGKGSSCGESVCVSNRAAGRVCDGISACTNSAEGIDCSPYVCDKAAGGCVAECTRDSDCIDTARCDLASGKCIARGGSVCKDEYIVVDPNGTEKDCHPFKCEAGACSKITACLDTATLLSQDGSTKDCAPYACSGNACLTACSSLAQCSGGAVCGTDNKCALLGDGSGGDGGGGCSCMTPRTSSSGHSAGLVLALAGTALTIARRRRQTSRHT